MDSWVNPTSVLGGVLAVCLTAYLAAFFLVRDAGRLSDETMVAYFRRRATAAAVAAGVVAVVGIFVLADDADYLFDGLKSRALPLVILSGGVRRRPRSCCSPATTRRGARLAAVVAVGSVVVAWGVAQWDYLLPDVPDRLGGGCAVRHHHRGAGGHRARGGPDRARLRAALRARPEDAAARGEHARAHARHRENP